MSETSNAKKELFTKLRDFAVTYDALPEDAETEHWYSSDLPSHDFNREILKPGENDKAPDGCVRIMSDTDFWEIANLPFHFEKLTCGEIVSVLWPDVPEPKIYPDHGDYWWTASADESLEVPGEPFELWMHYRTDGVMTDSMRFDTLATEQKAIEREAKVRSGTTEGTEALFEIRTWKDGERIGGELRPRTNVTYSPPCEPIVWPWQTEAAAADPDQPASA
ncbi:hypothetical protein [Rhizobium sp. BK176]|uniref:hypothetical protein n=1 Tax=Rhizobium sp. BK176 TaxID=2587071 RepID=UPI00216A9882|nr:hypothetical protein [Rhizobium sp. BK176]MCS4089062.1 hypothetical protein [Rhizobium sp. BK176]